jgi:hypothetical protein
LYFTPKYNLASVAAWIERATARRAGSGHPLGEELVAGAGKAAPTPKLKACGEWEQFPPSRRTSQKWRISPRVGMSNDASAANGRAALSGTREIEARLELLIEKIALGMGINPR